MTAHPTQMRPDSRALWISLYIPYTVDTYSSIQTPDTQNFTCWPYKNHIQTKKSINPITCLFHQLYIYFFAHMHHMFIHASELNNSIFPGFILCVFFPFMCARIRYTYWSVKWILNSRKERICQTPLFQTDYSSISASKSSFAWKNGCHSSIIITSPELSAGENEGSICHLSAIWACLI